MVDFHIGDKVMLRLDKVPPGGKPNRTVYNVLLLGDGEEGQLVAALGREPHRIAVQGAVLEIFLLPVDRIQHVATPIDRNEVLAVIDYHYHNAREVGGKEGLLSAIRALPEIT